jgi:hypothetical protein
VADKMKQRWLAKDGSVFVAEPTPKKFEYHKKPILVNEPIAFNVGQEMAEYLVALHNKKFEPDTRSGLAHEKAVAKIREQ